MTYMKEEDKIVHRLRTAKMQTFFYYSISVIICLLCIPTVQSCDKDGIECTVDVSCLDFPNLDQVVDCLHQHFINSSTLTAIQWGRMKPMIQKEIAYQQLIESLLERTRSCSNSSISPILNNEIKLFLYQDSHCLIMEYSTNSNGTWKRGWPLVAIHLQSVSEVHLQSAHYHTDGPVDTQAAGVYHLSDSRSLVLSTVARDAVTDYGTCEDHYHPTDGAHDIGTLYYTANQAVWHWQQPHGCMATQCIFIEFHGKATTSCSNDTAFVSAGLSNSTGIYTENTDLPANKLASTINNIWHLHHMKFVARTPYNSTCNLVATTNVFGKQLNSLAENQLCREKATTGTGYFIHIEQAYEVRQPDQYPHWAQAIDAVFNHRHHQNKEKTYHSDEIVHLYWVMYPLASMALVVVFGVIINFIE